MRLKLKEDENFILCCVKNYYIFFKIFVMIYFLIIINNMKMLLNQNLNLNQNFTILNYKMLKSLKNIFKNLILRQLNINSFLIFLNYLINLAILFIVVIYIEPFQKRLILNLIIIK